MAFERPDGRTFRVQRVEKPWGHEVLWGWTDRYAGKVLHVRRGESLSLQFHEVKDETISVLAGEIEMEIGTDVDEMETLVLRPGDCIRLVPRTLHRVTALADAQLLEVSTPELGDVVRLSDRYGRVT